MTDGAAETKRTPSLVLGVSVALTVPTVIVFLRGDSTTRELLFLAAAAAFAVYVTAVHPLAIFVVLAAVLGFAPFTHVPGTEVPMLLVLAVGVWGAFMFMPGLEPRLGWCEAWVLVLAAVASLSVLLSGLSGSSLIEYVAWVAATAVVIPIRFLPAEARRMMARVFILGTAAAAAMGLALRVDPQGVVARLLSFTGVDPQTPNVQLVAGSESVSTRLNGTYLEANIAGFILAAGLLLALAFFSGWMRVALVVIIGSGLLLTLSRSALATVAVALVLLLLRTGGRQRRTLIVAGAVGALSALAIPGVRSRLLDSFGPTDTGSAARLEALQDFSGLMDGSWIWGLGWARPEFRDADLNRAANLVANTPLATVYRGGVILGFLVVVLMIALVIRSWVNAQRSFADAVVCCSVMAFVLVALQLDYPVVLQASATVAMSMLVGLSMHRDDRLAPAPGSTAAGFARGRSAVRA
jgi:hypothetical protein